MPEHEIPILNKTYDLYKTLNQYRNQIAKTDRHTIYERIERTTLDIIEHLYLAGHAQPSQRTLILEKASAKLNLLRLLIRLMKDTKSLQTKQYITTQTIIDDIGRQLGGWIRSNK